VLRTITRGRQVKNLSDISAIEKGWRLRHIRGWVTVDDDKLMLEAFRAAAGLGIPVICHCEDKRISGKGVVNLGFNSTRLGLRGISNESEYKRVERDIGLASGCGVHVHIAHVSCRQSVEIIAAAKKNGVRLTCETAPHYFALTDEMLLDYDTNMKINPPLRSADDLAAIRQGLKDGTIDAIASDHAPHTGSRRISN
jgi:dihydroorotase